MLQTMNIADPPSGGYQSGGGGGLAQERKYSKLGGGIELSTGIARRWIRRLDTKPRRRQSVTQTIQGGGYTSPGKRICSCV